MVLIQKAQRERIPVAMAGLRADVKWTEVFTEYRAQHLLIVMLPLWTVLFVCSLDATLLFGHLVVGLRRQKGIRVSCRPWSHNADQHFIFLLNATSSE